MRLWMTSIALSLVSSVASMIKLRADSRRFALSSEVARRDANKGEKMPEDRIRDEEDRREKGRALLAYVGRYMQAITHTGVPLRQRQTLLSQLIMDSMDIWIPATNLGYARLNDGTVGLLG